MLKRIILGVAALSVGLSSPTVAHDPPDLIIPAAQFPAGAEPVIDGNPVEWGPISVETYGSVGELLYPVGAATKEGRVLENAGQGEINPADFQIRHKLGWSANTNKFYWLTEVYDDLHVVGRLDPGRFWVDDSIEYGFNFKHQAIDDQIYTEGDVSTQFTYKWTIPALEGQYEFLNPRAERTWLLDGTKWLNIEWTFEGDEFGESTYFYEAWIRPFDFIPDDGDRAAAEETDLEEGQVIAISWTFGDFDTPGGAALEDYQGFWSVSPNGCCRADNDMVMSELDDSIAWGEQATAVESNSWGRIKTEFKY